MKWLMFAAMAVLTFFAYAVPPAKSFQEPELARIIFWHLPCAFLTVVYVIFASISAWRYLATRDVVWEFRSVAANEIGLATATVTMITGILFSKVQWGAWWQWDPRQTSFLIVLLLLGAYFAIRMAFEDETLRARAAAAYSAMTLLPNLFLIFVFPRLPQVVKVSFHPTTTIQNGAFSPDYWSVVLGIFVVLLGFTAWLYRLNVRIALAERKHRNRHGNLEADRDHSSTHRVDRIVPVR